MFTFLVGGYGPGSDGKAFGISSAHRLPSGVLGPIVTLAAAPSPTWLKVVGDIVYAALEDTGEIASYRFQNGTLTLLSRHATAGGSPCHLDVCGDALVVACYENGAIGVHPLTAEGVAGPLAQKLSAQKLSEPKISGLSRFTKKRASHAHHVLSLDDGRVLTLDLGTDRLHVHRWVGGKLKRVRSVRFPAGSGPRDIRLLADGTLAVLAELSNELFVLRPHKQSFRIIQNLRLHHGGEHSQAAGLDVSADGLYLYAGLRGPNLIAIMGKSNDLWSLKGSVSSEGEWPRHLTVVGEFLHVSNQKSHSIASFARGHDGSVALIATTAAPSPTQVVNAEIGVQ